MPNSDYEPDGRPFRPVPIGCTCPLNARTCPHHGVANKSRQGHCPDHPGPLDDARGHVCRLRPTITRPKATEPETCLGLNMDCGRSLPCPDHPMHQPVGAIPPLNKDPVARRLGLFDDQGRPLCEHLVGEPCEHGTTGIAPYSGEVQ